ncbi:methyltransferase domain-containing protein [Agriterribacter sp.]|uniref:methyltransferase domain-containing protein n=1 Tax=Agriterribacter sp. TaxID=2821509 RepID=UPI002B6FA2A9|nr:methyltransferase domain-containing protein [Agriterribacter sp.]HRO44427.1 methyltransferase domain-containing protein [Agriterribacter sp.]HRQ19214.1 methyltransferase domain-containing protein [Agriterribacter sp.]
MSRYHSYVNTSVEIVRRYTGGEPLAVFLGSFFAAGKKYGSKDRKQISHLCYCYYRTGKMFPANIPAGSDTLQGYILAGLFLCSSQPNEMLQQLSPEWNEKVHLSIEEKYEILHKNLNGTSSPSFTIHPSPFTPHYSPLPVFPWKAALSEGIDHSLFCHSFFMQPDLFIRIRAGYKTAVQQKLDAANIPYRFMNEYCIALQNNTKLDAVIETGKEAVIQDYSSQQVAEFLKPLRGDKRLKVWDCCAASGGKSILAMDVLKNIELTVSDIRKSMLVNLEKRFAAAGIKSYTAKVIDLTIHPLSFTLHHLLFDLIICDAPCSGSGTWARTPEQLYFWKEENILHYTTLQKKILTNIVPFIKPGGHLLYITCSVFKEENEAMVNEIKEKFKLQLLKMEVLKGYDKKADTLFAALLTLPK